MSGLTLSTLRTQAKSRADLPNSAFVSDTDWNFYINEAGAELHDLILQSDPSSIVTIFPIALVTGTEAYDLPANFYKVTAVYSLQGAGPGNRYALDRTDFHGLGDGINSYAVVEISNNAFRYALAGSKIYFYPTPSGSANSIQLWYYPSYTRLVSDSDTVNYPVVNGWEQFIVLVAAIKAKMKQESDINAELAEKAELKDRIIKMATSRDNFNAALVRDTYGSTYRLRRYATTSTTNITSRWR